MGAVLGPEKEASDHEEPDEGYARSKTPHLCGRARLLGHRFVPLLDCDTFADLTRHMRKVWHLVLLVWYYRGERPLACSTARVVSMIGMPLPQVYDGTPAPGGSTTVGPFSQFLATHPCDTSAGSTDTTAATNSVPY
jgi:hypothetical protein